MVDKNHVDRFVLHFLSLLVHPCMSEIPRSLEDATRDTAKFLLFVHAKFDCRVRLEDVQPREARMDSYESKEHLKRCHTYHATGHVAQYPNRVKQEFWPVSRLVVKHKDA